MGERDLFSADVREDHGAGQSLLHTVAQAAYGPAER
jgi:hypothetical protein